MLDWILRYKLNSLWLKRKLANNNESNTCNDIDRFLGMRADQIQLADAQFELDSHTLPTRVRGFLKASSECMAMVAFRE